MMLLPEDFWEIKKTEGKGRGVFARKEIKAGTIIGDYIGTVKHPETIHENTSLFYGMSFDPTFIIYPDIESPGIHLINHSCAPNCEGYPFQGHMLYFALRHIFPEEELTVTYSLPPPDYEQTVCRHACKCGTPICRGSMHTSYKADRDWDNFVKTLLGSYYGHAPVVYNQHLQLLASYPETIEDNPIYDIYCKFDETPTTCSDTFLDTTAIRKIIRSEGRPVYYPSIKSVIFGVANNMFEGTEVR